MRQLVGLLCGILGFSACADRTEEMPAEAAPLSNVSQLPEAPAYPETMMVDQTDTYFGTEVADPYRWLEDDVRVSEQVEAWVTAQNEVTDAYLAKLPGRAAIASRLQTLWDYEKFSVPERRENLYFFYRNDGLQNQFVYYVQKGLDGAPRVLIDPNSWSDDGATALADAEPSPDGRYVAYAIQDGGSDWRTVRVLDVASGEVLEDTLDWVKFSGLSWAPDGSGFYYSRFPAPEEGEAFQSLNYNQTLYFHRIGAPQSADEEIFARPDDPEIGVGGEVVADRYLVITMWRGTDERYEVAVKDLQAPDSTPRMIITGFEYEYDVFGADETTLWVRTNEGAPNGQIVAMDLGEPELTRRPLVPETKDVISRASVVGDAMLVQYLADVTTRVDIYQITTDAPGATKTGSVDLPGLGSANGFQGDAENPETFYAFSSFNVPTTIYRFDAATGESAVFKAPETPFDPAAYEVRQVFYPSKDSTEIPMFVVHKRGLDFESGAPTLLYGYGGFNISLPPSFSITNFAWMEMGGVFALANLRGGGEYGKAWHDAGRLLNKQNVFDDFIAAGEYLVAEGMTTPEKLSIYGRSNGGLLVGTVVNQRPDLFAAALPAVGVMDMLRFDKFTAGRYWTDDYGKPSENEADFRNNYAYSPYHNIAAGETYPAVLVTTADTDDRVVPGHSFKYIAALQAVETGDAPKLIRIETRAGHGAGKPTDKIIAEYADMWAFIAAHTGLEVPAAGPETQ